MLSRLSSRRVARRAVGLLFVVGLVLAVTPASAITYGLPDTAHPFVGAIVVRGSDGSAFEFCSGTLISARVFLSAGHCTIALTDNNISREDVFLSFGPYILDNKTWRAVDHWVTSPAYWWGPMSDPHDLGVVILKNAVVGLGFGVLAPKAGYLDGLWAAGQLTGSTLFMNVGYGTDQNMNDTNVREYSMSSFRNLHKAWLYMSQNVHTGNGGTCFGDSGGPTFYTASDGSEYLVAVTSWGDAQCKSTNNNYRADTAESLAFIGAMVAANPE